MSMSHRLGVIEPWTATGKLPCADFTQQVKAHWFAQDWKWQPLVAQVRRLPSLRKGDSLKVGQPTPLSSRMIGQPLSHWRTRLHCFHLLSPKVKAGKALGVILRVSTRCYLHYSTFPPDSIIQDHLPVARHSIQDPIRHTCILSIVGTNKRYKTTPRLLYSWLLSTPVYLAFSSKSYPPYIINPKFHHKRNKIRST